MIGKIDRLETLQLVLGILQLLLVFCNVDTRTLGALDFKLCRLDHIKRILNLREVVWCER